MIRYISIHIIINSAPHLYFSHTSNLSLPFKLRYVPFFSFPNINIQNSFSLKLLMTIVSLISYMWQLTMANVMVFNHVVPNFGIEATTTSLSLGWKWFWKEIIDCICGGWQTHILSERICPLNLMSFSPIAHLWDVWDPLMPLKDITNDSLLLH
jgi:hypothetical protein